MTDFVQDCVDKSAVYMENNIVFDSGAERLCGWGNSTKRVIDRSIDIFDCDTRLIYIWPLIYRSMIFYPGKSIRTWYGSFSV